MKINIQSLHFNHSSTLQSLIEEKVSRLNKFHSKILNADVCLKIDKAETRENKYCEMRLSIPGNDVFAKKSAKSFEEAVSICADALKIQLQKASAQLQK